MSNTNSSYDDIGPLEVRMKVQHLDAIQLYSAPTLNGIKVAACLEEIDTF